MLLRAIALVEPGGCVAYSTCSFNPLEDEAVVQVGLRTGAVQLETFPRLDGSANTSAAAALNVFS